MPATAWVKFDQLSLDVAKQVHDFHADTLKVILTNTLPDKVNDAVLTDITEISAGNGYVAGGVDITNTASRSGPLTTIAAVNPVITATGGAIGPYRWIVVYNDTASNDELIAFADYLSSESLPDGQSLTVDMAGVFGYIS